MVEPVGVTLGAVALLGLFNNAVDTFELIQIGRGVGRNFQLCQHKLDFARVALTRWGRSIGLADATEATTLKELGLDPRDVDRAGEHLGLIIDLFEDTKKVSDRYKDRKTKTDPQDTSLVVHEASRDLSGPGKTLHEQMNALCIQRQSAMRKRDKVRWALYDGKAFERLVADIGEQVEGLVKTFPAAQPKQRELAKAEVAIAEETKTLPLAKEAALDNDTVLKDAIETALKASGQNTSYNYAYFSGDHNSGIQIGQQLGGTLNKY